MYIRWDFKDIRRDFFFIRWFFDDIRHTINLLKLKTRYLKPSAR